MPDIIVQPAARQDIIDIYMSTYEGWGESQAEKYDSGLDAALQSLKSNPGKGPLVTLSGKDFRKLLYGMHVIFYRHQATEIRIIRILHQSMDPTRHLTGS